MPTRFLYDEYIDRPKLSEQKNPFEYIIPPSQVGSEQQAELRIILYHLLNLPYYLQLIIFLINCNYFFVLHECFLIFMLKLK